MSKSKQNIEISMLEAGEHISVFFNNNQELIDTFNTICAHMLDLDGAFIIRTNGEIIGISKHGEFYRLYVSKKEDEYFIKYKNRKESEKFIPSNIETYFSYNKSCNEFFVENKDSLVAKERTKKERISRDVSEQEYSTVRSTGETLDEWIAIKTKAENALKYVPASSTDTELSDKIYKEIIERLTDAGSNREFMAERDGDIIVSRILNPSAITLQNLGEKYDVTRERIRQREKSTWRKLTTGIYRYKREKFIPYREWLQRILLGIPDESFINTIAQIYSRNAAIGLWLQTVIVGTNDENNVSLAIKKSAFPNAAQTKPSVRIPAEVINSVKNTIDIVEYISSQQDVTLKGKNYHAHCPFCGTSDALVVYPETKSFYCFSCTTGGDVITYLMKTKDLDYKSAVSELASLAGIEIQPQEQVDISKVMREAAMYYHEQLKTNAKARPAIDILHSWGIQGKTIVQLGIGFHDNSFNSFMNYMTKQKSYSMAQLDEAKLVLQSAKGNYCDKMRNSIIIPTIDANGNVVCFDFYITDKQQLFKYPNTKSFARSQNLYSYNLAIRSNKKSVIIVTTYEDYFKLIGLGITNVVSTYLPKITDDQLKLLKQKFKVIILITNQHVNAASCSKYCRENNMYCDQIDLQGCSSVVEYIEKNSKAIIDKVDEYERILT